MATSPIFRSTPATLRRRRQDPEQTSLTLFPTAARHGTCEQPSDASAPPEPVPTESESPLRTKPATELVGIARLAASSLRAEAKRGTEYFLLPVKSILNHCDSENVPFRWTVNPYRGCEFGCKYCYARYTHEYMDIDGGEFETKIYVKKDAGALVDRDLSTEKIWGEHIAIGTATDPYQPAEREFGGTRAILEKMVQREGLSSFDHDKIGSGSSRHRFAAAYRGAIFNHGESEHYDCTRAPRTNAGTACSAAGSSPSGCS